MLSQQKRTLQRGSARRHAAGPYVVVIADMVESRSLAPQQRARAQKEFAKLVGNLNKRYRKQLRAKFAITLGDEFQGLLRDPAIIPDLVWKLEEEFTARELRLGFGYGGIFTSIHEFSLDADGPAFHKARAAMTAAKRGTLRGGVFNGFGAVLDPALNGLARILHRQRAKWPARQLEVLRRLHDGHRGTDIAQELGITKQAVSRYASLAGWDAYVEGEAAWRGLLSSLEAKGR